MRCPLGHQLKSSKSVCLFVESASVSVLETYVAFGDACSPWHGTSSWGRHRASYPPVQHGASYQPTSLIDHQPLPPTVQSLVPHTVEGVEDIIQRHSRDTRAAASRNEKVAWIWCQSLTRVSKLRVLTVCACVKYTRRQFDRWYDK